MGMKMDLQERIDRLRFQLKELAGSVSMEENSMAVFFIEQNWGDEEFDAIADVFDRYDADLLNGAELKAAEFEKTLGDAVGLSYQGVKALASTLYRNDRWQLVCYHYAKALAPNPPIEVHHIIRDYEEHYGQR